MSRVILINKPYGYLSQFSDHDGHPGLSQLCSLKDVYPAGRLDRDSEGLLILTDDGKLQARLCEPSQKSPKTYLIQVENKPSEQQVLQLQQGVALNDGLTKPARVSMTSEPSWLWTRMPPVRTRANIPTSWLQIIITEGRNRQIRRMTAAVGLPTLRLIRTAIGHWQLGDLQPGEFREEVIHLPHNRRPKTMSRKIKTHV